MLKLHKCAHCTVDYLSAAVGGDRARRGADIREREGERMEGGIPLVLDKVLEAMVLESVHFLVLGSGWSLLGRERGRECSTISIWEICVRFRQQYCQYSLDGERRMQG